MPKAELIACTEDSEGMLRNGHLFAYIGRIAGVCTDRAGVNDSKRAIRCIANGHLSVLEHVSLTWRVTCTRACSHQLVRHRMASYCQESQRYVPIGEDWYELPSALDGDSGVKVLMDAIAGCYRTLTDDGVPYEDARAVLPNAALTNIIVTMNLREFLAFLQLRLGKSAQAEIRSLATAMNAAAIEKQPELRDVEELLGVGES